MRRMFPVGLIIVLFLIVAYATVRSAAVSGLPIFHVKSTPTPRPTPNTYIPNLGKALSNQSVQIWALQQQMKALQSQVKSQQATIQQLQGQVSTLSSKIGSLSSQWSAYKFKLDYWFTGNLPAGSVRWSDLKTKGMSTTEYDNIVIPGMYALH